MYLFIHAAEREHSFLVLVWKMVSGSISSKIVPDTIFYDPIFFKSNAYTKSKELFEFLTFDKCITFKHCITLRGKRQPDVLDAVDVLLQRFSLAPNDLKGICVLSGPGQFSFLRSSIVTANTFGFALRIPVVGIESTECATEKEFVQKGLKKLSRTKRFRPVVPEYGKEPNITIAKKKI